jgi:GAF domain-containing protein
VDTPGRSAFEDGSTVYSPDLRTDPRFEGYSSEIVTRTPIRAVLSFGLRLHDEPLGVISFYSATPDGFPQDAQDRARLLADHATIAIDAASSATTADHLRIALESSRTIGAAIGILVERYRVTPEQAFHMLRTASSRTNQKLSRVAEDLVRTASTSGPEPVDEGYGWAAPSA